MRTRQNKRVEDRPSGGAGSFVPLLDFSVKDATKLDADCCCQVISAFMDIIPLAARVIQSGNETYRAVEPVLLALFRPTFEVLINALRARALNGDPEFLRRLIEITTLAGRAATSMIPASPELARGCATDFKGWPILTAPMRQVLAEKRSSMRLKNEHASIIFDVYEEIQFARSIMVKFPDQPHVVDRPIFEWTAHLMHLTPVKRRELHKGFVDEVCTLASLWKYENGRFDKADSVIIAKWVRLALRILQARYPKPERSVLRHFSKSQRTSILWNKVEQRIDEKFEAIAVNIAKAANSGSLSKQKQFLLFRDLIASNNYRIS